MVGSVRISTDSTVDLSPELIDRFAIHVTPLTINIDGGSYRDGVDIDRDTVFEKVKRSGKLPNTAAVSPAEYEEYFREFTADGSELVHINISEKFSACYQNACIAAREVGNVEAVDSRNLSTGIGHLVLLGAELAQKGMNAAEIAKELRDTATKVDASFVIDTLDYLYKGGRCSALAYMGANLLKLKPCIEVREGAMGVQKKYRGKIEKVIMSYVNDRMADLSDIRPERIFITHTGCAPEVVAEVRRCLEKLDYFAEILETQAGCTVGSHCGPNTLGVLYIHKKDIA